MPRYYVNNEAQTNGDHEVHKENCRYLPNDRTDLGIHSSCHSAVKKAKSIYSQSNGCIHCARECHTS